MGTAGQLIVRRYQLVRALGHGRTGLVWEGRDTLLDRPVAIREVLLPPDLGETARLRLVQRVSREARQAERLRHPHIAAVYDVAEEGDTPYVVTELVPSRSLDGVVSGDGPLPPAEAARVARTVLSALTHAHAAGVRHGDVRPTNVLLAHDGRVLLADFGVSMLATDPAFARDPVPSSPSAGRGTETYLAPERPPAGRARSPPTSGRWAPPSTWPSPAGRPRARGRRRRFPGNCAGCSPGCWPGSPGGGSTRRPPTACSPRSSRPPRLSPYAGAPAALVSSSGWRRPC
ncbi:serine/threonine-protein kinase [Microbispora sp. GKU 823]|uniref:serine/threonine-protein kinase n=1 Tax=Microbispora sp. GKU 823 TaxID=1652100 RepID=UPI0009A31B53|nr:serine/threonine-protein kinase [Microbispora sp. GKU 823]OPG03548.1 hypothetical protein B1L11_39900 [Microbispora sp. GKU 823]